MINIPFTRAARIELILSNGRMSLSPQLILDVLWFGGLLHLLSAESVGAAAYLQRMLPRLPRWLLTLLVTSAVAAGAIFNPPWLKASSAITSVQFVLIGAIFAFVLAAAYFRREAKPDELPRN